MSETFTPKQLAERWHCTEDKVRGLIANKALQAVNTVLTPGAHRPRWIVTAQAVERFEAARMTSPPAPRQTRQKAARPWKEWF